MNTQIDIFGNEVMTEVRKKAGPDERRCGTCGYIYRATINDKIFYMCNIRSRGGSNAEIGLGDLACGQWKPK